MKARSIREDARLYFLPVILGGGKAARSLAAEIMKKYRVSSVIASDKPSLRDALSLTYRLVRLQKDEHAMLLCHRLIDICRQNPYTLPILIPTESRYRAQIEEQRALLEPHFVICDPETATAESPLSLLERLGKKS